MKIKVTLQQEIEYDSEDFLRAPDDCWEGEGFRSVPRAIDSCSEPVRPDPLYNVEGIDYIQIKDLRIGDALSEDDWEGYSHHLGVITKIESLPDGNTQG